MSSFYFWFFLFLCFVGLLVIVCLGFLLVRGGFTVTL